MHHHSLVFLRNAVESLLDHMATERVHTEVQRVAFDCIGDCNDLLRSPMLETTLNEKVAKAIDHQRIGLVHYSLNNIVFLLGSADLEFLLKEKRGLLVIVTDNLVHYILPVAGNILVQKSAVVEWFKWWNMCLHSSRANLRP